MVGHGTSRRPSGRAATLGLIALFLGIGLSGCIVGYPDGSKLPHLEVRNGDLYVYRLDGSEDEVRFEVGPTLYSRGSTTFPWDRTLLVTESTSERTRSEMVMVNHYGAVRFSADPCLFRLRCEPADEVTLHMARLKSGMLMSSSALAGVAVDDGTVRLYDRALGVEREWRLSGVEEEVWRLEPVDAPAPPATAPDVYGCDARYHAITFHRDDMTPLTCETDAGVWRLVERQPGDQGWTEEFGYGSWDHPRDASEAPPSPLIMGDEALGPRELTLGAATQVFTESAQHQALEGTGEPWALWGVRLRADGEDCTADAGCGRRYAWRFTVAKADGTSSHMDVVRDVPAATDGPQVPVVGGTPASPTTRVEESPGPAVPPVERLWGPSFASSVSTFLYDGSDCRPRAEDERSPCGFELRARHREGTVGYDYVFTTPDGEALVYDAHLMHRNPVVLTHEDMQQIEAHD